MRRDHIRYLACPACKSSLEVATVEAESNGQIETGTLYCPVCGQNYPIIKHIPRFVPLSNYAQSFGFQWNIHAHTQIDRMNRLSISETRFFNETRWARHLSGETILEVGSGSGRFTEQAAKTGAMVVSLDYSHAVEANYQSNGHLDNVLIVQGSIYQMPFQENCFDKVFCIGVLQHTPDVKGAFMALPRFLKPGGKLVIDVYIRETGLFGTIKQLLKVKYWVRPFTRHITPERLYQWCNRYVRTMWPVARLISRIPRIGRKINFAFLLISDYRGMLPLSETQLLEWAILDTFDMLSPAYDSPQSLKTVRQWFDDAGLDMVEVHRGYNGVEGRAVKRSDSGS